MSTKIIVTGSDTQKTTRRQLRGLVWDCPVFALSELETGSGNISTDETARSLSFP